ncbi:M15 family metallopeptidase [Sphingomonas sp. RP10(2022)]|uniref:M15 family metallopeptidase n=1 Tax=Sphingomonas liriopis TaxID=2949094 RepID=A0A9X2HR24_9SPHN|nr:M15 family metallopeptidase [Sphingomonas liriopis]MCP3734897.1 M15 family metallopeptidase [Sphingomonas liriopis]
MRRIAPALLLFATPAGAQVCAGASASMASDGRAFGHLPYGDAPPDDLVAAPAGFALNGCQLRRDVIPDLERLLAAAQGDSLVMGQLRALSCHRSIIRQASVFCRAHPGAPTDADATRAISVAPPGHSEHSTGYTLDFAIRPANGCPDAEACMAATPAARWLVKNAPRFGFEMSFPGGNKQNVKWEPWHWRWVGTSATAPGAARARFVFARARDQFPADPAVDRVVTIANVVPVAFVSVPAWVEPKVSKKKRRR